MDEILHAGIHWGLVNFAIFVGLLVLFLKKPVKEFWTSRQGEIRFEIGEAERLSREAHARNADLKQRLSRLDADSEELILALEREGEMEKKQLMEAGRRRAERMRQDADLIRDQEARKTRESLKAQVAHSAVDTAEKMIRENLRPDDQARLTQGYLSGLERQAV